MVHIIIFSFILMCGSTSEQMNVETVVIPRQAILNLTFEYVTESKVVTIQMKLLQKYFNMVLLLCNLSETEVWYFLEDSF